MKEGELLHSVSWPAWPRTMVYGLHPKVCGKHWAMVVLIVNVLTTVILLLLLLSTVIPLAHGSSINFVAAQISHNTEIG